MDNRTLLLVGSLTYSQARYDNGVRERYGGGVMYGGRFAARLGIPTRVVTIGASDIEPGAAELRSLGIAVQRIHRETSNNFSNDYRGEKRTLFMRSFIEDAIHPQEVDVQVAEQSGVILFPLYHEISAEILSLFGSTHTVLLDPSGFTRSLGKPNQEGIYPVRQDNWETIDSFAQRGIILKLSNEDLERIAFDAGIISLEQKLQALVRRGFPWVILTQGAGDTFVVGGNLEVKHVPTFPVAVKDPAGAGEAFAVGLLARYLETRDMYESAAFGNACASGHVAGETLSYQAINERAQAILTKT